MTVAVCAHVSGRCHPLHLFPPPERLQHCSPTPCLLPHSPGQPDTGCSPELPGASQAPPSRALAAVWVLSEPAVSRGRDWSGSFLSQLREPLTWWTHFWAGHCQAAAGVLLGTLAGGLRAGSTCPDVPWSTIQLSVVCPHGCATVSPVGFDFLISGMLLCVCVSVCRVFRVVSACAVCLRVVSVCPVCSVL